MRRKVLKKVLTGTLTATMVIGMSMTAFAAGETTSGSGSGTGTFEGHVDKKVTAVTLPTASATTFSYKMDPEGLIAATNKAKYSNATFESGANVFFLSSDNTWTKDSAKLKVINKGTVAVDVTVTAKADTNDKVAMATTDTFESTDTDAKLYLGLKVADKDAVAVDTAGTTGTVTVGLGGNEDNFEITSVENGGYAYTAKTGVPDTAWNSFEFGLTGACNPKGDYSAENLAASNVTVTWSYVEHPETGGAEILPGNAVSDAAPSIATTTYSVTADTAFDVIVSLGAGEKAATTVSSARLKGTNTLELLNGTGKFATYSDGKLSLTADLATFIVKNPGVTIDVVFDNGTIVTLNFTVSD